MNRSYDDFMKDANSNAWPFMDDLRKFCFSLGSDVVEDVRMHRVVFCKSFAFRWFVDMEPQKSSVLLKIQKSRKETQTFQLRMNRQVASRRLLAQELIREAYSSIH